MNLRTRQAIYRVIYVVVVCASICVSYLLLVCPRLRSCIVCPQDLPSNGPLRRSATVVGAEYREPMHPFVCKFPDCVISVTGRRCGNAFARIDV